MNLCTDRLVLALADPDQIRSLSFVAVDPNSMVKVAAKDIPLNHGRLEEMLAVDADYIFASEFDDPRTIERLRLFGKDVRQFPAARTINDAKVNIQAMAELMDQTELAEHLIQQLSKLVGFAKPREKNRTIILGANNYISGKNSLASHLVETLGFKNIAAEAKISDYGQISMEQAIDLRPDVIIVNKYSEDYSRAQAVLQHPVLKHLNQQVDIYYVPTKEWICGDTALLQAANRLM